MSVDEGGFITLVNKYLRDRLDAEYLRGTVDAREAFKADFYATLLRGTANPVLADVLGGIHARVAIFRRFAFVDEARVALSHLELVRIIDAVAVRRDTQAADDACAHHIRIAGELALIEYERRAPGFRRD